MSLTTINYPQQPIAFIVISDLHLNHHRVSTIKMVNRIVRTLKIATEKSKLTHLVISGDVFDRATQMDTPAGKAISQFIAFCLDYCRVHDLTLVLLKGTSSHDGNQCEHFVSMNRGLTEPIDLIYIDKPRIFKDRYGLTWLGVPDDANPTALQTQAEVEKLFKAEGIAEVDVGVTHGLYDYHMLAGFEDPTAHKSDFYISKVKYVIINGHIHTSSSKDILTTVGSHDRGGHGQQEDKGGLLINIDRVTQSVKKTFIVNKDAERFDTVKVDTTNVYKAYKAVVDYIHKTPLGNTGGFIRVEHNKELKVNEVLKRLKEEYHPLIEFNDKQTGEDKSTKEFNTIDLITTTVKRTPITQQSILDLIGTKLEQFNVEDIEAHKALLKPFI